MPKTIGMQTYEKKEEKNCKELPLEIIFIAVGGIWSFGARLNGILSFCMRCRNVTRSLTHTLTH